jgi:hypothetical protein
MRSSRLSELTPYLANLSFSQGQYPSQFKLAAVTPLPKSLFLAETLHPATDPISNLNGISKIIERLSLDRFQIYITSSPNLISCQSAYRKYHSTETALLATLNSVYTDCDHSSSTPLVVLDLSATFDAIDHQILISGLETSFGVDGTVLLLLLSYLSDCSFLLTLAIQHLKLLNSNTEHHNVLPWVRSYSHNALLLLPLYLTMGYRINNKRMIRNSSSHLYCTLLA